MRFVNNPELLDGIRVVQDYEEIANALENNETVYHWEYGDSMYPMLRHMEYCKICPLEQGKEIKPGDAVFCKIKDKFTGMEYYMVHIVLETADFGHDGKKWYKIGSTGTTVFGWTTDILGIAYGTDIFQLMTKDMHDGNNVGLNKAIQ